MRRLIATVTTAAVLVGGAAAASASDPGPGQRSDASASSGGQQPDARSALRRRALGEGARIAAETIGVEPRDVIAATRSGKSIAALATENGVDPQIVIDALVAAANDRIDKAVADGKIDEGRATQLRSRAAEVAARLVAATRPPGTRGSVDSATQSPAPRRRAIIAAFRTSAETIDITPAELAIANREGISVGDVATEHGVDPQTVVDALITAANERIDKGVADGKLDDARATKVRQRVPQLAERFVSATRGENA